MWNKRFMPPVSFAVIGALAVTGLWGCLLIYASRAFGDSPLFFVKRQLFWVFLALCGFVGAAFCPFEKVFAWRYKLAGISLVSLWLVLLFGEERNGMHGWFALTENTLVQPSEFAKGVFLLVAAGYAGDASLSLRKKMLCLAGAAGAFCIPILLEPDFGSASLFFLAFLILLYLAGGKWGEFLAAGSTGLLCAGGFLWWKPYALDRILGFWNPDSPLARSSWHLRQFRYALAHGGLSGSEQNAPLWSNAYLPLSHSDSLYATITETSGLIGALIVLCAFCAISCVFLRLSMREDLTQSARLYISGTAFLYLAQALLHISVNVLLLPTTGITLPLLSYGGSSLCSTMLAFGLAAGAARQKRASGT